MVSVRGRDGYLQLSKDLVPCLNQPHVVVVNFQLLDSGNLVSRRCLAPCFIYDGLTSIEGLDSILGQVLHVYQL